MFDKRLKYNNNMPLMRRFLVLLLIVCGMSSCYYDTVEELYPQVTCDTANVTYSGTIKPLLDQYCATSGCHNAPTPTGWDFTRHDRVKQAATVNNRLLRSITHSTGAAAMPKDMPKLDDCAIAKFRIWIDAGCPEN